MQRDCEHAFAPFCQAHHVLEEAPQERCERGRSRRRPGDVASLGDRIRPATFGRSRLLCLLLCELLCELLDRDRLEVDRDLIERHDQGSVRERSRHMERDLQCGLDEIASFSRQRLPS